MTSSTPRISIVTPTLNMGAFLEDAILSVQSQQYPNFEHIVIDACSTDNTREILERYPHVRWLSEKDRGQSDALNKGFRMATGDIIGWLNADEYYLPGSFHAIADAAMANSWADVFYGDGIDTDEVGRANRVKSGHEFDYRVLLYYGCFVPTMSTFFRRNIFEEGLFIDIDYKVVMDFEYFVHLATAGKRFCYVPCLIGVFRWTGTNASLQRTKRRMERLLVQRTWSSLKLPNFGYDTLAKVFRAKRILMKAMNGNYGRERFIKRTFRGERTDWFRSEEGRRTCTAIVEGYCGRAAASGR
jgi:glycosyltransferase involved in cell wall biosynthesis